LDAISVEPDREVLLCQLECMNEALGEIPSRCLAKEQMEKIVAFGAAVLADWKDRNDDRIKMLSSSEHTDEDEVKLSEEELNDRKIARQVVEIWRRMLAHHADLFLIFFPNLVLPIILELLEENRLAYEKQRAICVFVDIAEFYCAGVVPYFGKFIPMLLNFSTHNDPALRQAAVFGLGACGLGGGDAFAPYVIDSLRVLSFVIQQPNSRVEDNIDPTENAISAILKIVIGQPTRVNPAEILPVWLTYLPITGDEVEAQFVYEHLCTMLESSNPHIIGENFKNIPHIIKIFATVTNTDLVTNEIDTRIARILQQMQASLPPQVVQSIWASLTEEERGRLLELQQNQQQHV